MKNVIWEFLNDYDDELDKFNMNIFTTLGDGCLTLDMSKCEMSIFENKLMIESINSPSYGVIDLDKVVMVEFIEKGTWDF